METAARHFSAAGRNLSDVIRNTRLGLPCDVTAHRRDFFGQGVVVAIIQLSVPLAGSLHSAHDCKIYTELLIFAEVTHVN
jgi:hypothetical protein